MHYLENDIKKLKLYCKSLGLCIRFHNNAISEDAGATYCSIEKLIEVDMRGVNKTMLILLLLHEISHHIDFQHRNKKDSPKLQKALQKDNDGGKLNKNDRFELYQSEIGAAYYMPLIAKELDLKIPYYKVLAEADLDKWIASYFLESNEVASNKVIELMRKNFRNLYKEEEK